MSRSRDDRGERLRARMESEQSHWPKATVWVIRQWWIYVVASVALASSALSDLADHPAPDARADDFIALTISGLLLVAGVIGFVNRRKGAAGGSAQEDQGSERQACDERDGEPPSPSA